MYFVNIYVRILSNNIFITIVDNNNQVKSVKSMGSVGFQNKDKKIKEGFKMLISDSMKFISEKKLYVDKLELSGFSKYRLKAIKDIVKTFPINYCKIKEKTSYNGCRLKKQRRKRSKLKIKVYKQF